MSGISVKLPIHLDGATGKYALNKTYAGMVKQNFKNLILTMPGERMMIPEFGVGLLRMLFDFGDTIDMRSEIESRIQSQVDEYMPYLEINNVKFVGAAESHDIEPNMLNIRIEYKIVPLSLVDFLEITT